MPSYYLGVDGGGTRTTVALGDAAGRELARREGAAGIVDPRWPLAAAESVVRLAREVLAAAGASAPVEALCAGLAGSGDPGSREVVRSALEHAGVARRVIVCSDGEIALEGALPERAGILLVAGTGSVAWGRAEDGRVDRCGGWGMIAGDEGSAYWLGREALRAALQAEDGRGGETVLRRRVVQLLGVRGPEEVPAWAGRAAKAEVAALAQEVVAAAEAGDGVAQGLVREAAAGLGAHALALVRRLGPWEGPVPVVMHGGLGGAARFAGEVAGWLGGRGVEVELRAPVADAVTGALRVAGGRAGPAESVSGQDRHQQGHAREHAGPDRQ